MVGFPAFFRRRQRRRIGALVAKNSVAHHPGEFQLSREIRILQTNQLFAPFVCNEARRMPFPDLFRRTNFWRKQGVHGIGLMFTRSVLSGVLFTLGQ